MATDPIVEEVRQIRDAIAREHGYDVRAIVRALQQQEVKCARQLNARPAKRIHRNRRLSSHKD